MRIFYNTYKVSPSFLKRKAGRPYAISAYGDPVVRALRHAGIYLQPEGPNGPLGKGSAVAGQADRLSEERSLERLVSRHQSEWRRAGLGARREDHPRFLRYQRVTDAQQTGEDYRAARLYAMAG